MSPVENFFLGDLHSDLELMAKLGNCVKHVHKGNTKWTQQLVFVYLYVYVIYITIIIKGKCCRLRGNKRVSEGVRGRRIIM